MITPEQCLQRYGEPDENFERKWMTFYTVPPAIGEILHALPRRIYCNKDILLALDRAFQNIIDAGVEDELKTWDGCFNIRSVKGSEKPDFPAGKPSLHSWGIAVDVNAAWNQRGKPSTLTSWFVKCWVDAGFNWGGRFKTIIDPMHFEIQEFPGEV